MFSGEAIQVILCYYMTIWTVSYYVVLKKELAGVWCVLVFNHL